MCYLTIKEMANISEDVIIVTSRFVLRFEMTGIKSIVCKNKNTYTFIGLINATHVLL